MCSHSALASSYSSSLRAQLNHHLLQDCLNCPPPPTFSGLETPSSALLQPLCFSCQSTFYPTSHRSCLGTHGPESLIMKIRGSEVSHTLGSDLISLSFCFLLGQMGDISDIHHTGLHRE